MSFQSLRFMAFLPLCLCAWFIVPRRLRLSVLLVSNAVFYLSADLSSGVWLVFSAVTTWLAGLLLNRLCGVKKRAVLIICLAVNVLLLFMLKYLPSGNGIMQAPLGISFYTLEAAGYLLDVAAGKYAPEKNVFRYAAFLSFFPTVSCGPIERGGRFLTQLDHILSAGRRELFHYDRIMRGLISVLWGFFMKMVVADRLKLPVDYLYAHYRDGNSFTMLAAAFFYAFQIYCDFASYSCIAAGIARIMGIELIRNFRQPYFAAGIFDFWRRWHVSLSSWLKDYIYIPLGGNRKGVLRKYLNLLTVFTVSGLWHGGAPVFLVWGFLHGICLTVEDACKRLHRSRAKGVLLPRGVWACMYPILTFCTVSCLWIFFRSDSLEMAAVCLKNLFTRWQGFLHIRTFIFSMGLNKTELMVAVAGIIFLVLMNFISERKGMEEAEWIYRSPALVRWGICLLLISVIFVFGEYGAGFNPGNFIYIGF